MKQRRSTLGPNRDGLNPANAYFKAVGETYRSVCGKCGATRTDAQIGLEPTPEAYVETLVAVFGEVKRVLRDDGTVWLNLGDSYARDAAKGQHKPGDSGKQNYIIERGGGRAAGQMRLARTDRHYGVHMTHCNQGEYVGTCCYGDDAICPAIIDGVPPGYKPKDLLMIPARVALALQADGWWLRSDIIWHKPNPMPESVTDRPTSAHEHVFLLTKRERYFYDAEAVREPAACFGRQHTSGEQPPKVRALQESGHHGKGGDLSINYERELRNARNVWTIASQPFSDAHFATFPPELAERCIKAGTSERGCCPTCGAPWERRIERTQNEDPSAKGSTFDRGKTGARDGGDRTQAGQRFLKVASGWVPTCACPPAYPVPCTVLDPFAGAFTTCMVADRLQRNAIGIELSEEYCGMARRRLLKDAGLFADITAD
jgi:DNA modification methylase